MRLIAVLVVLLALPGRVLALEDYLGYIAFSSPFGSSPTCSSPGCYSVTNWSGNSQLGWEFDLSVVVNGSNVSAPENYIVNVQALRVGQIIRALRITAVNANPSSQPNDWVAVNVLEGSGRIVRVDRVEKVSGGAHLAVSVTNVGQLGSSAAPAVIRANSIGGLITHVNPSASYSGDAFLDAVTVPESPTSPLESRIDTIGIGGNLHGHVRARRQIEHITVSGGVGSPGNPATITSETNEIGVIDATGDIYAHITTGVGGVGPGDYRIRRVRSTNGSFFGSLVADDFWGWFPSPTGGGVRGVPQAGGGRPVAAFHH
ncbi:MAG: hypothetical protein FJ255_12195 [Phycisphaerae bacterium]|nr:hypothetical protein [Phycisphaerae bacterium]